MNEPEASVLVVTNIPNHYRIPLFNELRRQLQQIGFDLVVVFAAETYDRRQFAGREHALQDASFRWHVLNSIRFGRLQPLFLPVGLGRVFDKYGPSAVIAGGTGSLALAALLSSKRRQVPFMTWTGEFKSPAGLVARLKRPVKRYLLSQSSAAVVYGSLAAEWVRKMAPSVRCYPAWNTVDIAPFLEVDRPLQAKQGPVRLISVGDLRAYKGYRELLAAFSSLGMPPDEVQLTIIGEGPQRQELEKMCTGLGLEESVLFLGSKPHSEIPAALAQADIFVLPSREPWGLVLVEAMAVGLPAVASSLAGAAHDLVVPGAGAMVDPNDTGAFSLAIRSMVELSVDVRNEMGQRARRHVSELCSLENSAAGFVAAFEHAIA